MSDSGNSADDDYGSLFDGVLPRPEGGWPRLPQPSIFDSINPDWMNGPVYTDDQLAALRSSDAMKQMGLGDLTQPPPNYLAGTGLLPNYNFSWDDWNKAMALDPARLLLASPGTPAEPTPSTSEGDPGSPLKVCPPVDARILQGNEHFIGRSGAWGPTVPITADTAAIVPNEFGMTKGQLRPFLGQISGTVDGQSLFNGVADKIDNKTPPAGTPAGMSTPRGFEYLNPGRIILEVPGLPRDLGVKSVTISVPSQVNCPVPPKRQK